MSGAGLLGWSDGHRNRAPTRPAHTRPARGPPPRPRRRDRPHCASREGRGQGRVRGHRTRQPGVPRVGLRQHRQPRRRLRDRSGVDHGEGRLALRADLERVRGLRDLARARQVRQHPARPRRRGAGVPDDLVGRHDVQRGHGHRADVLRCQRADHPLRHAAAGHRRGREPRGRAGRDGDDDVPLDAAPVGDLRRRRPGGGVRRLPQGAPAADQLGLRADPGRPRPRPRRQGDRHVRHLRHPVRLGHVARARRAADRVGAPARRRPGRHRQRSPGGHHRRPHRRLRPLRRVRSRQGHPVALQHQHGARHRAGPVRLRGGPPSSSSTWCRPRSAATWATCP
jgi:hypothetical protein